MSVFLRMHNIDKFPGSLLARKQCCKALLVISDYPFQHVVCVRLSCYTGIELDFYLHNRFFPQQTQVIAAAAAGVAAEGLAPKDAKAGAENAAQLSVFLVENAIVILMLVEDHLRSQSKQTCATNAVASPSPLKKRTSTLTAIGESSEISSSRASLSSDSGKVPLDVSGKHSQMPNFSELDFPIFCFSGSLVMIKCF